MNNLLIYMAFWFGMVPIAILNGAIREKLYGPFLSELTAHQISTASGIVLFAVYIGILTGMKPIESPQQAFSIGAIWLIMTILFEFVFGHWVMKHPWSQLFHDYNLLKGRVWALMLIWTAVAPYLFYRLWS